jgi:hypothetical protein
MNDYIISGVRVTEVPVVGADLRIVRVTRVSMLVGTHGPFSKDFYPPHNTQDDINAWKIQQQQYVQSVSS